MTGWQVFKLKEHEHRFRVRGHGMTLEGEVWQGVMKGDVFWGLKSLEHPHCRYKVLRRWRVVAPRAVGGSVNTGANRLFLRFEAATAASFVLRFSKTVPPELVSALKEAFAGPQNQKENAHEVFADRKRDRIDPAAAPERHREGGSVGGQDRHPAEDERGPGPQGLEVRGRRQVTTKAKKGRKSHAARKPGRVSKGGRSEQGTRP